MAQKPQGAGSLWNPNSWHWEEKDYTNIARKVIEKKVSEIKTTQNGITITFSSKSVKGDAQINIRKGKQVLIYDFDVEVEWKGKNIILLKIKADSDAEEAEGTFILKDITSVDQDFECINCQAKNKTPISEQCREIIRKTVFAQIKESFKNLLQELAQNESDPEKLKLDQEKRIQAEIDVMMAREQNGQEKERIFWEQKEKEKQMKEQFSQWNQQAPKQQQQQQQQDQPQ